MPTQKVITVYSFSELSEKAKEKARDKFREHFDFEWYAESVIEDAKTIAELFGLDIDKIYYSGFYHQGSGASFDGIYQYKPGALKAVKEYAPLDTELHAIVKALQAIQRKAFYKLQVECTSSNYYGQRFNVEHSELRYLDVSAYEDGIAQPLRDFASWIYSRLEAEYEYLTSDEPISEFYANNEYEFKESGAYA